MTTLIYKGDLAEGYIEEPGSGHQFPFIKGEPVLLPDDLAAALTAQTSDWQKSGASKPQKNED
jgi:hypothetical protein